MLTFSLSLTICEDLDLHKRRAGPQASERGDGMRDKGGREPRWHGLEKVASSFSAGNKHNEGSAILKQVGLRT